MAGLALWLSLGPVIAGLCVLAGGRWFGAAVLATVLLLPAVVLFAWRGRRTRRIIDALPDTVEAFSRSLRSGASFSQALSETAAASPQEIADDLHNVDGAIRRGRTNTQALEDWVGRSPLAEVRVVAAVLALASENESGTTQALDGVHQSLRDRAALDAEIRALTAQASSSMRALVLLPAGFLMLDMAGEQRTLRYLIMTPLGACLHDHRHLPKPGRICLDAHHRSTTNESVRMALPILIVASTTFRGDLVGTSAAGAVDSRGARSRSASPIDYQPVDHGHW